MLALIERKKGGGELNEAELLWLCEAVASGRVPDYQVTAWLMAVCLRGMSDRETLALTRAMVATGSTLDWSGFPGGVVDKHSTGGVGDKISLVLVPLIAAAGLRFAKMSGRGLGHTGGTLDKLESIPGFRVELSRAELEAQLQRIGCALVGQSADLVPADRALYALRDATATFDSLPLIAASVMSKKLAAGARCIVLDVKYGSGALLPAADEARELAATMVRIGVGAGRRVRAVLSPMQQPLGRTVGNALEVREAIETLRGTGPADVWELTLALGEQLLVLAGAAADAGVARATLTDLRDSGRALDRLAALIAAQGGDAQVVDHPDRLPRAEHLLEVRAPDGSPSTVAELDARTVGDLAVALGAGRHTKSDRVDPGVGIVLHRKLGAAAEPGDLLAEIHARTAAEAAQAAEHLLQAYRFTPQPAASPAFSTEVVGA